MITRRILNSVSKLHSARLVALVEAQHRREDKAADAVSIAERFSRWANKVKTETRAAHLDEIDRTEVLTAAVRAELQILPAVTARAAEVEE